MIRGESKRLAAVAGEASLRDAEEVLSEQEQSDEGPCAAAASTAMHENPFILAVHARFATLLDHFPGHVGHSQVIEPLVTAARGCFVILPVHVHDLLEVVHICGLLDEHVTLGLGDCQALSRRLIARIAVLSLIILAPLRRHHVVFAEDFASNFHVAQDQPVFELAALFEHLHGVLDDAVVDNLRLERHLGEFLLLELLQPRLCLLRWLILTSVLVALLMAADLVVADLHDELDVGLHDHVQEVADCVFLRGARCNEQLLLKA